MKRRITYKPGLASAKAMAALDKWQILPTPLDRAIKYANKFAAKEIARLLERKSPRE